MRPSIDFARLFVAGAGLAAALSLFGCASPGTVVPNQSTAAEVRGRIGRPINIRFDANGDELWEYPGGLEGMQSYVVRIGKDRRVKSVTQLITMERFNEITTGKTTKAQVREILGEPGELQYLPSGLVWEWRVFLAPATGHFVVRFNDDDVVSEKSVLMDVATDGGDKGGSK
jgi:hypothetical protein